MESKRADKDQQQLLVRLENANNTTEGLAGIVTPARTKLDNRRTSLENIKNYSATPDSNIRSQKTRITDAKDATSSGSLHSYVPSPRFANIKITKTENKEDFQEYVLKRISSYQDRLKFFESYNERRQRINQEFTERVRHQVSNSKLDWVSPYDSARNGSPKRMKVPQRVPKLIVQASQAKITSAYDYIDQDEMYAWKKPKKDKKVNVFTHFSYDQSSIMKYIDDFVRLASLSKNLELSNFTEPADNNDRQKIIKKLQFIKQTIKPEEIIEPPSNIAGIPMSSDSINNNPGC